MADGGCGAGVWEKAAVEMVTREIARKVEIWRVAGGFMETPW
jgi:hypothetical protein